MTSEPSDRGFDMSGPQEINNEVTRLKVHIKLHSSEKQLSALLLQSVLCL